MVSFYYLLDMSETWMGKGDAECKNVDIHPTVRQGVGDNM